MMICGHYVGRKDQYHYYTDPNPMTAAGSPRQIELPCGCPPIVNRKLEFMADRTCDLLYRCISCGAGWTLSDWMDQ